ncbi:hypothetical protein KAFR_0K01640 [Kazachstania africana CBS 2517]|uniref:Peptidase S54 rhomboid domain-containing protein n=1 Tax=Kazachstania africana (strain ATCC 22294 / BCRC 22015 / CBS 2517 / CECT 1963 / NBRC 1671 / NRRL Y-8276) TaxID=1071382 RepID=H2B1L8_KAZAF|nr:hypothetical protein KAFR_0K01640 [Kazachstania africana CBS 2517]CCF60518.1 hypothetical protein KAFR_0K01640 [Kazachstania africana CBS 2517]
MNKLIRCNSFAGTFALSSLHRSQVHKIPYLFNRALLQPHQAHLFVRNFTNNKVLLNRIDKHYTSGSKLARAALYNPFDDSSSDRYSNLNRFQQFQHSNNQKKNTLSSLTIIGLTTMTAIYFGSDYLFDHIPPFTYLKRKPRTLVYILLGINTAIFGLWQLPRCWRFLQKYMLLQKDHIQSKWSIVGSAFSHQEFWHLGFNMLALWSFGTSLASMLGTSNFFSLYMNSAIAGSLFSLWYPKIARMSLMGPSLGASGALFGVMGCFSYLIPNAKILLFVFPIPGGAWVAFLGTLAWNTAGCVLRWGSFDYAAHLGGSLIGVIYGWCIKKEIEKRRQRRKRSLKWF